MTKLGHALVVEDHPEVSQWIRQLLLQAFPRLQVELATDLREARRKLTAAPWQLALVDLGLPDGSGLQVIRELQAQQPATQAIVLTVHDDDDNLFAALRAGAQGYLLKEQADEVLLHQLRRWAEGQPPLSPRMATRILEHFRTAPLSNAGTHESVALTARETEVLSCIGRGFRIHETAKELGIAESTVATYVKSIYGKLNINSRAEAALEAARRGLA